MFDSWGSGEWAVAIAFIGQLALVVGIIATMRQQVKDLESRVATLESHKVGERLAVIESGITRMTAWLDKQEPSSK